MWRRVPDQEMKLSRYEERIKLIEESCGNGKGRVSAFDALSPVPPAVLLGIKQEQGGGHNGARPVKIVTVQTAHLLGRSFPALLPRMPKKHTAARPRAIPVSARNTGSRFRKAS